MELHYGLRNMKTKNEKALELGIKKAMKIAQHKVLDSLEATAWDLVDGVSVPILTHNLWDSIGCGIYYKGELLRICFPNPEAVNPSIFEGEWGRENLEDKILDAPTAIKTYQGYVLYYVAAMPYSETIDNRPDVDVLRSNLVKPIFETYIHML